MRARAPRTASLRWKGSGGSHESSCASDCCGGALGVAAACRRRGTAPGGDANDGRCGAAAGTSRGAVAGVKRGVKPPRRPPGCAPPPPLTGRSTPRWLGVAVGDRNFVRWSGAPAAPRSGVAPSAEAAGCGIALPNAVAASNAASGCEEAVSGGAKPPKRVPDRPLPKCAPLSHAAATSPARRSAPSRSRDGACFAGAGFAGSPGDAAAPALAMRQP